MAHSSGIAHAHARTCAVPPTRSGAVPCARCSFGRFRVCAHVHLIVLGCFFLCVLLYVLPVVFVWARGHRLWEMRAVY